MDPVSLELGTRNLWSWLVRLLSRNSEWLSAKMRFFLPTVDLGSSDEASDPEQRVIQQLSTLHAQGLATWQSLIHCVCMELEVPLAVEVPLLSTWGQEDEFPGQLRAGNEGQPGPQLHCGLKRPHQSCGSSPHRKHGRKQQLELARKYLQLLKTTAQQHCGTKCSLPEKTLASHHVYVPPILQWSRATAPLDTQQGASIGDPKAEDVSDVRVQDLFNFRAHKGPRVTVLLGKAGMGKTTLARRLCQKWADGQLDHFQALFLFEFRQLNLITRFLTLPQLLFDGYLSPESGPDAVFQYLEENASRVLLIFDGLDEAIQSCSSKETLGPDGSGSVLTLFSSLCCGTLLPGCWVMATSRPGKLPACLPREAAMVHIWGFDGLRVEEYMSHFFHEQPSPEMALEELRTNGPLRSMCTVPGLCQVTCLCLRHLLPGSPPGQSAALLPTVTQLYMQMVFSLSLPGSLPATSLLGLGEVALRGLDTGKVIFYAEDIPPAMMAFGAAHNLLTSFCVCTSPRYPETGYAFAHLSLQEFFAALYLMASSTVDKDTLARHVTLNSHWVLRTKARLGLSDQLPTFLAGLASHTCRPFLSHLAEGDDAWVSVRQATVVQVLKKLATRKHTGPKVVELCHYVAETQEAELASLTAQSLPYHLPFHNFPLTFADLAALTNILEYRANPMHLEFEGCPLEPHCPEALVGCGQVETLRLAGSKITARGIGHLVQALPLCTQLEEVSLQDNQLKEPEVMSIINVLPCLPRLRKLDLSRNNFSISTLLCLVKVAVTCPTVRALEVREEDFIFLFSPSTETTAVLWRAPDLQENESLRTAGRSLALRLQKCQLRVHDAEVLIDLLREGPHLEEVDLSANFLEDEGCRLLAEAAPRLHIAKKLDLSDNGISESGVFYLLTAMSTCQSLAELHISLLHKTVVLMFAHEPGAQEGPWESLMPPMASEPPLSSRRIRLTHCGFQAKHIERLCKVLGGSCYPRHLGHLDLSSNALGDEGVDLLAQLLPGLGPLQSLNLSKSDSSLDAVLRLAQCMVTLKWVFRLDISFESQHIVLRSEKRGRDVLADGSLPESPAGAQFSGFRHCCIPRSFSLKECQLEPSSLTRLCATLEECPGPLEVQLSCKALSDESLKTLLHCLPRLPQLSLLQLSQTALSPRSPLLLADIFSLCPKVQKVELRSLNHVALHFGSSEEQEGVCCGFLDCSLSQEQVEPLCCLLSKCEALSHLDLATNLLGDDGLRSLLEHLPQTPISGRLDLSHNNISQEGALHLVETLTSCPRVQAASVNLGPEQNFQIYFSQQEEARVTLRLSECNFGQEHTLRLATGLSQALQLVELTLTHCILDLTQLTTLLSGVRRPAGLLHLRVEEPWVGKVGVPALLEVCTQASGHVTEISISETQQQLWVQLEFPHQEESPEAMALRLTHCDLETHHNLLVRQLMTCARLRQLSLSQVNLCDASNASSLLLQSLMSLSELKTFRLTSSCVSTEGLTHLASGLGHCYHLEELDFSNSQFTEEGTKMLMAALEGKSRLKRLHLSHCLQGSSTLAVLIRGLSHMMLLQCLRLSENSIDDVGCYHLSEALRTTASLEELGLSHNQIEDAGAQHLAAILPGLPKLRKIDLSANRITPVGGAQLVESLTLCQHLEELMLGCNTLGDPTALGLAQRLPQHLRILHLPSSHLGPEGVLSLGQALDGYPFVEEISLAQNSLAKGVPHFCKGLPLLRRIDLISCEIDNQSAKHLVASFLLCPALEEILLSWNFLGDEAAAELAGALPRMGRLKKVDLEKNRITAHGASLLVQGLAQGAGVQVIRLWNNPIPSGAIQSLQSQEPRLDFTFFDKQPQVPPGT
ncbi:protein NLRC5 isoform X2 [Castor canadensis]|uniref:Protein NLRC5 isoform X2 n=1 Tax=Castor canadensis TaxID=51338 RepID=A0AC58L4G9_CASCN